MVFDDPRISRIGSLEGQMDLNGIAVASDFAIVDREFLRAALWRFLHAGNLPIKWVTSWVTKMPSDR